MKKSINFKLVVIIAAVSIFTVAQVSAFEIISAEDIKQNIVTKDFFKTYYEMQPYNKAAFRQAIDRLPSTKTAGSFVGQPTPLAEGIKNLDPILANLSGKTAIFIFSDGTYQLGGQKLRPLDMARNLVNKYNVKFYLISSAKTPKAEKLLTDIAALNEGSRVISFDALYPSQRFNDKAAVYYQAELRLIPRWNPFKRWDWLQKYVGIQWLQFVPFAEVGRVAPSWNIETLHTDMKWSLGLGVRAWSKGIVVRIDSAVSEEDFKVQMMVAQPFQF